MLTGTVRNEAVEIVTMVSSSAWLATMVFDTRSALASDAAGAERRAWQSRELHGM